MVNKENNMTRKFNVGDVVINFESIDLWDNIYHYKQTLQFFKKEVVTSADDYCFTTAPGLDVSKRLSLDYEQQRKLYGQRDGRKWGDISNGTRFYGNLTTNEAGIRKYLQKKFDEAFAKCDKEDADEIAKLEAEIRRAQARIEAIKAGKRPLSYDSRVIERDFLHERVAALNKVLDS
jgi:predicted Zn-dependent protease